MLRAVLAVAALALAPIAWAQAAPEAIRSVIGAQIEAMRADDFATAFGFASPGIQRLFGTPERFERMVREGYPMVRQPRDVRFLEAVPGPGRTVQGVLVTDGAGVPHVLDYEMVPLDGGWRIDGVRLRQPEAAGA
jgi:hypothetical protein